MIRYLKYIVIVFGSIGIGVASFFGYQNRVDISKAFEYREIIDYDYLQNHCLNIEENYYYPCLIEKYQEYLQHVSLTGSNIGLRMMFSVMNEDKAKTTKFPTEKQRDLTYTINFLVVNNYTMSNAHKRYFGFQALYGGFISSLAEFYPRAFGFSDDLIAGLESPKGLESLEDEQVKQRMEDRLKSVKKDYYRIKKEALDFIEKETVRIQKSDS